MSPQKIFSQFVPDDYKPLLSCVSPSAFSVIEWKKILAQAPALAKRIATGAGVRELRASIQPLVPANMIFFEADGGLSSRSSYSSSSLRAEDGASVLELYFSQLKSDDGLFLDLRSSSFSLSADKQVVWHPNGLWTRLDPEFREGMLAIYRGYYLGQPELLRQGLLRVGLIKADFSAERIAEVESMILSHVGGDTSNQSFRVAHFTQSFEKLFLFLLKEKIVLPPDFLYLGIYLAGLYLHLEALGGAYDVRQAFMSSHAVESGN
jgi:hypothetical protein